MDVGVMVAVAVVVLALPFVLMVAFHGRDEVDSRGRRLDTRWRVRRHRGTGP